MASTSTSVVRSSTVLGKRKVAHQPDYVLHLVSSPEPTGGTDSEEPEASTSKKRVNLSSSRAPSKAILVNGKLFTSETKKRYACTYEDCSKAYAKPIRLEEHERSHTGFRPFICNICSKSYLRETHLRAHARIHLPDSEKPFVCTVSECLKRFWTKQHLRVHLNWHNGAKPFICDEPDCSEAFAKHHQLRTHKCTAHAPSGTKPYQCPHDECTKSFATSQHLRTHMKVHNDKRYACVQGLCVEKAVFFPTWTSLQHHIRTEHPPTCSHPQCNGRQFASQKGLRAHQKLHDECEVEAELDANAVGSDFEDGTTRQRKRRRGGELGRDWKCEVDGCTKDFKSSKALATHHRVTHLGRRDFVCPYETCGSTFGYKHMLQRHLAKLHTNSLPNGLDEGGSSSSDGSDGSSTEDENTDSAVQTGKAKTVLDMSIDAITGVTYAIQAKEKVRHSKALRCPFPSLEHIVHTSCAGSEVPTTDIKSCDYVFSRAYDLRRHLRAQHSIEADRSSVEEWVAGAKKQRDL